MDFLLYIILRHLYCSVCFKNGAVFIEKGIFLRQISRVEEKSIVCAEVISAPLSRLFRVKMIRLKTPSGEFSFFLPKKNELLTNLKVAPSQSRLLSIRPSALSIIYGAFIDARALGGVLTFSYALNRIGRFFGQEYPESVLSFINSTANELSKALEYLHVAVPRFTAAAAVFTAAAWLAAFTARLVKFARFRLYVGNNAICTMHGLVTLYERFIPKSSSFSPNAFMPCVFTLCDTATTLLASAAPVYLENEMLFPPIKRCRLKALAKALGVPLPQKSPVRPPLRAIFGYAAAPLVWCGIFSSAALICNAARISLKIDATLLCPLLWCAAVWCGWLALSYALYSRHAVFADENNAFIISTRRSARLYTAFFSARTSCRTISQSVFQRKSGLCDIIISAPSARSLRFRLGKLCNMKIAP